MSFTRSDGRELADLLIKFKGQGPIDETSEDGKRLLELLSKLNANYDPNARPGFDFDNLRDKFELQKELAKKRGEILNEEKQAQNVIINIRTRHLNTLRRKIVELTTSGQASEQELQALKDEYREQSKILKIEKTTRQAEQKGDAIADEMLQNAFGIKRSFLGGGGMKGLQGLAKGFGKGLTKSLGPAQLMVDFVIKVYEQLIAIDKGSTQIFQQTGMSGYSKDVALTNRQLIESFGPEAASVAATAYTSIIQGRKDLIDLGKDRVKLAEDVARYSFVGVSADALIDSSIFFSQNLGKTADEQQILNRKLYQLSEDLERPPEQIFREMAQTIPVLGRYGNEFPRVFYDLSRVAQKTNISISDLQSLVESTDTTKDVFRASQKFNALLGGSFINPAALLAANPAEKVKIIAEAYQKAQEVTGKQIPQRVIRSLYQQFGLDAQKFQNIVKTSFASFEQESKKFMAEPVTPLDAIREQFMQGLKMSDKIMNQFSRLAAMAAHMLMKVLPTIMGHVISLFNYFSGSENKEARKKLKEAQSGLQQQAKIEAASRVKEGLGSLISGGSYNQMMNIMKPDRMIKMGPGGGMQTPTESSGFLPGITNLDGVPLSLAKPMKVEDGMGSTVGMANPMLSANYPIVAKKFETSQDDGVLLSRLADLRDKINQYTERAVSVNLNVGNSKIGEAIM